MSRHVGTARLLLIASACAGTALLAQRRGWLAAAPAACSAAGFYLVGMVAPTTVIQGLAGERLPVAQIQEGRMTQVSRKVADFLRSKGQPTDLVAVNHAGALPYYSQMPTLDMTGLNDHHIAHRAVGALHGKFDPDYVLANKPRFVVLNSNVKPDSPQRLPNGEPVQWFYYPGYWAGETALWKHPEFLKRYRFTPKYWTWSWVQPRYILVAERIR